MVSQSAQGDTLVFVSCFLTGQLLLPGRFQKIAEGVSHLDFSPVKRETIRLQIHRRLLHFQGIKTPLDSPMMAAFYSCRLSLQKRFFALKKRFFSD